MSVKVLYKNNYVWSIKKKNSGISNVIAKQTQLQAEEFKVIKKNLFFETFEISFVVTLLISEVWFITKKKATEKFQWFVSEQSG